MKSFITFLLVLLFSVPLQSFAASDSHDSIQAKRYYDKVMQDFRNEVDNHVASEEFMLAATAGSIPLMDKFLAEDANPNYETPDGLPVLFAVLDSKLPNKLAIVRELINDGVDVNARYIVIPISMLYLQEPDCDPSVLKAMLDDGLIVNPKHTIGGKLLNVAAGFRGNTACVKLLIQYGANVNYTDRSSFSPLLAAIFDKDAKVVSILLANGANPNLPTYTGDTPLIVAVEGKQPEVARLLLKHGANSCLRNEFDKTAKDYALKEGDTALAKLLVCKLPRRTD